MRESTTAEITDLLSDRNRVAVYWPFGDAPYTGRVQLSDAATHVAAGDRLADEADLLLALHAREEDSPTPPGWRKVAEGLDADGDLCEVYEPIGGAE